MIILIKKILVELSKMNYKDIKVKNFQKRLDKR